MITLPTTMAVLESCPKHNMVAYLEKTEGNVEFHKIIDFLTHSSIHHARTVSPIVSTTFVEQFWTSAKSKIINNVKHITAKVVGKSVSISEASIRSDILFDDADGIDSLPNQVIFDAIQLMGKVFSFMVKKGKHFSGKVTPLFATMLVQPTQDEGASSERPSEAQPTPSPAPTSEVLFKDQANEIQDLKAQITKLKKQAKPVIKHHKAYLKSVSLKQRFLRKSFSKKHRVHKESVSKQGRKFAKCESSVQRDPLFDEMHEDTIDHMDTENAQSEGRIREMVDEDKEIDERILSTEDVLSTDKEGVSTDFEKVNTDRPIVSIDGSKVSTDRQIEGTEDQVEGGMRIANKLSYDEHYEGTEEANEVLKSKEKLPEMKKSGTTEIRDIKYQSKNGSKYMDRRDYFSTLMTGIVHICDREVLNVVYQLVNGKITREMPEGLDWIIVSWKLHSSSGIHTLVTDTGLVIHMLVEKKYPLRKEVLMQMLKLKLESEEENTMALELIKFVKKILAELESEEHKNWLVHKQTACGKDFSNPFMVDNLPKIVRFLTHLASVVKSWLVHDQTVHELAIPEQTATGKGTSNPLMAGSLPKTIKPT
ncbi:hypothetical protein Tco_1136264 [Tanacetum coccineum]